MQNLLEQIDNDLMMGKDACEVPDRFESYEKYERKANKLKESLELELEERGQVDNVLSFFMQSTANSSNSNTNGANNSLLDDSEFYKPMDLPTQ